MSQDRGRGSQAVTLAHVAAEAGVSPATASFVLSGRDGRASAGSEETKRKVREAAERLSYVPNRYARAMRTGRSDAIVLALGTVGDPWGIALTRSVRERALPHGLSTVVLADERWYEFLGGYASDCAFVTGAEVGQDGQARIGRLSRSGIRVVAFSTQLEPDGFDVVSSSSLQAARDAFDQLRTRHDRVDFLATSPIALDDATPRSRGRAFLERSHEIDGPERLAPVRVTPQGHGRSLDACLEWLSSPERPSAVVCGTGYLALALQSAALRLGIAVPEELEIIAIGDIPEEAMFLAPISYYGVQDVFGRIAQIVVDRAVSPLEGTGTRHVLDWQFFPGATTRNA